MTQQEKMISKIIASVVHGMGDWLSSEGVIITDKATRVKIENAQIDVGEKYQHISKFISKRLLDECDIIYEYNIS